MQKQQQTELTSKQEKFAQALAKGLSQRQAYREAYPTSKTWTDSAVDSKACNLSKNVKVLARLKELNQKIESKTIMSAKQLQEFWTKIALNEDVWLKDRLKASELLAKSQGAFIEKRETAITSEDCVIKVIKHDD